MICVVETTHQRQRGEVQVVTSMLPIQSGGTIGAHTLRLSDVSRSNWNFGISRFLDTLARVRKVTLTARMSCAFLHRRDTVINPPIVVSQCIRPESEVYHICMISRNKYNDGVLQGWLQYADVQKF